MATDLNKIIAGSDLMLFKDGKSIAHASNHTLTIEPQLSEVSTKDTGLWGMSEVTKINWSINAEHMYVQSQFVDMFDQAMATDPKFEVYFGLKEGYKGSAQYSSSYSYNTSSSNLGSWTPEVSNNSYLFYGDVIINSLEVSAQAGENATFSVSMTGVGPLQRSTYPHGNE